MWTEAPPDRRPAPRCRPCHPPSGPRRRAFTLVELLVVISIISVLLLLLLPMIETVRFQAKRMACAQHVRQLTFALHGYLQDFDGMWEPETDANESHLIFNSNRSSNKFVYAGLLFDYLDGSIKAYFCTDVATQSAQYGNNWHQMDFLQSKAFIERRYGILYSGYATFQYVLNRLENDHPGGRYKRLEAWPKNPALFSDIVESPTTPKIYSPHRRRGWNIGYRDGSVAWMSLSSMPTLGYIEPNYFSNVGYNLGCITYWNTVNGFDMFSLP